MTITVYVEEPILENLSNFLNWNTQDEFVEEGNTIRGRWHLREAPNTVETTISYDEYIMLADNE